MDALDWKGKALSYDFVLCVKMLQEMNKTCVGLLRDVWMLACDLRRCLVRWFAAHKRRVWSCWAIVHNNEHISRKWLMPCNFSCSKYTTSIFLSRLKKSSALCTSHSLTTFTWLTARSSRLLTLSKKLNSLGTVAVALKVIAIDLCTYMENCNFSSGSSFNIQVQLKT